MLDFTDRQIRFVTVAREDRALQGCNLSARSMPGDGQEYMPCHMLLLFGSSSGSKAINLFALGKAQSRALQREKCLAVGHMSILSIRVKRNVLII
jgi:hypothetical protein